MKIHKLDYKIVDEKSSFLTVFLDGIEERAILEDFAFIKSAESGGLFPILNCSCGTWGCGGYWVEVSHDHDHVVWEKIRIWDSDQDVPALHAKTPIIFLKKDYQALADKLLSDISSNPNSKEIYDSENAEYEKTQKFFWDGE